MAKLFVVSKEPPPIEQSEQCEPLKYLATVKANAESALRALAFLIDFIDEVGPDELRRCADEIQAFRGQR